MFCSLFPSHIIHRNFEKGAHIVDRQIGTDLERFLEATENRDDFGH